MGSGIEKKYILQMMDNMLDQLEGADAALQVSMSNTREQLCTIHLNKIAEFDGGFSKLENLMVKIPVIDTEVKPISSDRLGLKLSSGF